MQAARWANVCAQTHIGSEHIIIILSPAYWSSHKLDNKPVHVGKKLPQVVSTQSAVIGWGQRERGSGSMNSTSTQH